jgi:Spy/CpxP family protein refolding chaperone
MARSILITLFGIFVAGGFLCGDDKATSKDEKTTRRPLPFYFHKLNLTEPQKKKIKEIRDDYEGRIRDLEEQIRELRKKERAEMEDVLTDVQKAKLRELLNELNRDLKKPGDKDK